MADEQKITMSVCTVPELGPGERCVVDHEGELDPGEYTIECPRNGSIFDLRSGKAKTLPAVQPEQTFPVKVVDETVTLEV